MGSLNCTFKRVSSVSLSDPESSPEYRSKSAIELRPAAYDNRLPGLRQSSLQFAIDCDHGLLDELVGVRFINYEQSHLFESRHVHNEYDGVKQLLDEVVNASRERQELFLSALDSTRQSHVTNYVRNDGRRQADTDDNWPLYGGQEWKEIERHWGYLTENIDIDTGLMDELYSAFCINYRQMETISTQEKPTDKIRKLLSLLGRKSVSDYKTFINCLLKTKQCHVVSTLDPPAIVCTATSCCPLSQQQLAKLTANYSVLVELIDVHDSGLIHGLVAVDCLTPKQRRHIVSANGELDGTRRLLDFLRRGSQSDYYKFIECLDKTGQQHVAKLLRTDDDVALTSLTAHGKVLDTYDAAIVDRFLNLLKNSSADRRQERLSIFIELFNRLGIDNELGPHSRNFLRKS